MLITMATYDTPENDRWWMTRETLRSLHDTVDWAKHRLIIVDNGSSDERTSEAIHQYRGPKDVIWCTSNLGTARGLNLAWRHRRPGEAAGGYTQKLWIGVGKNGSVSLG